MNKHLQQSALFLFLSFVTAAAFAQSWTASGGNMNLTPSANAGIGVAANSEAKLRTEGATKYSLYLTNTGTSVSTPAYTLGYACGIYTNNSITYNGYGNTVYGLYSDNNLNNTGYSGQVFGAYLSAKTTNTTSSRTLYGVYSTVSGAVESSRYAGYFTGGKVVVMDGKVGIGTTSPARNLEVVGEMVITNTGGDWTMPLWIKVNSNAAKPFVITNTITGEDVVRINGNGTMGAKKVYAEAFDVIAGAVGIYWFDHVFANDYKLRSLQEVEQFIKANNHLPEIPSAAEVNENGYSLSDMQGKLLMKVEELTLYIIEQQKAIENLQLKNAELERVINQ